MKLRKLVALALAGAMVLSLAACGGGSEKETGKNNGDDKNPTTPAVKEDVTLTLWGAENDQTLLREMCDAFIEANKDYVNLTIEIGVESESTAKDTILKDVQASADVYSFASDQLNSLVAAGALMAIPEEMGLQDVIDRNTAGSVATATYTDGKVYAYPRTADNGFFLFYDKSKFSEDDVKSWSAMLAKAAEHGKSVTMQMNSGWYLHGFYDAVGFDAGLAENGKDTVCNWNGTVNGISGVQVTQAIIDICKHSAFQVASDSEFVTGIKEGTIIAGVSGVWNAATATEVWGENFGATILPTFTLNGEEKQMCSVMGSKLVGVNPYSKNAGWALKLADWITNEENQIKSFEVNQTGPSNIKAASSDAVKTNTAIVAFTAQQEFASLQVVGDNFWGATESFGQILQTGNPDGIDLQTLLDNMVAGVTAPIE
ncbi:MAG: extracellular solute-binding protein [Lachnospiraceae bacterium]|nr:extracellular solute-binding protein [Lachnospiraceae bacterium]